MSRIFDTGSWSDDWVLGNLSESLSRVIETLIQNFSAVVLENHQSDNPKRPLLRRVFKKWLGTFSGVRKKKNWYFWSWIISKILKYVRKIFNLKIPTAKFGQQLFWFYWRILPFKLFGSFGHPRFVSENLIKIIIFSNNVLEIERCWLTIWWMKSMLFFWRSVCLSIGKSWY